MLDPGTLKKQFESKEKTALEDEDIPATTRIDLDVEGTRGRKYKGTFVFKVPTIGDQIRIGQMKAAYLPSGAGADPNSAMLVEQICFLEVTMQGDKPPWWAPLEMFDAAPISELYRRALDYERRFHGAGTKSEDNSEVVSGSDGSHSDGENGMGRKVQATAERSETLVAHGEGSA